MRFRVWILVAALLMPAACRQKQQSAGPFDGSRFVVEAMQITQSNAELGRTAARRAWAPVTRQLGGSLAGGQARIHGQLAAVAARRHIVVDSALQTRHRALAENLAILPGQVFDRGYALAMTQELATLRRRCATAAASDDAELATLARSLDPQFAAQQVQAQQALDRNGGSPFAF